ncbi:MAG TPA: SLC13 family permease [Alcaligenaceae bacterium]|nr:SLC13 family permease [Alcaligenaceae bacterium]
MFSPAFLVVVILLITIGLFLYGRWRHDIVAVNALLMCSLLGIISPQDTFIGFSHPAVVTVACILILSYSLQQTGVVDVLAHRVLPKKSSPLVSLIALTALGAFLSGFMNNVGALALLMPISLQMASRHNLAPGQVLMPLAFGTILGGLTTLIGTPSNLIVSSFRLEALGEGYGMFSFSPVGVSVAIVGVLFISLIGWRFIPVRERAGKDTFDTGTYLTEARVPAESKAIGMRLSEVQTTLDANDGQILGLIRKEIRLTAPNPALSLVTDDVLLIEAEPSALAKSLDTLGLVFNEDKAPPEKDEADEQKDKDETQSEASLEPNLELNTSEEKEKEKEKEKKEKSKGSYSNELSELVILPGSSLVGRSAANLRLRSLYRINLLAISRQGTRTRTRLRKTLLRTGDVLLLQGSAENVADFASAGGCAPLASRPLRVPDRRNMILASSIMLLSVCLAAFGFLSAALSFMLGVLLLLLLNVIAPRNVYKAVDWSVVVLLAALIPVAQAMERTGAAGSIATFLLDYVAQGNTIAALLLMMVATMLISDLMNNAATAAVMSPVAIGTAQQLGVNPDTFLMAVAVGASCAFLTPIGHQNNTLILGPGGFRFGDYWRMGLPLDIIIVSITIPLLLLFWPL